MDGPSQNMIEKIKNELETLSEKINKIGNEKIGGFVKEDAMDE